MDVKRIVLVLLVLVLAQPLYPCKAGRLEVKVIDCADDPVENAEVTVKCKSGGSVTARTNAAGVAVLNVSPDDVKNVDVTANVVEAHGSSACKKSPCTIKVCFSAPAITYGEIVGEVPAA